MLSDFLIKLLLVWLFLLYIWIVGCLLFKFWLWWRFNSLFFFFIRLLRRRCCLADLKLLLQNRTLIAEFLQDLFQLLVLITVFLYQVLLESLNDHGRLCMVLSCKKAQSTLQIWPKWRVLGSHPWLFLKNWVYKTWTFLDNLLKWRDFLRLLQEE